MRGIFHTYEGPHKLHSPSPQDQAPTPLLDEFVLFLLLTLYLLCFLPTWHYPPPPPDLESDVRLGPLHHSASILSHLPQLFQPPPLAPHLHDCSSNARIGDNPDSLGPKGELPKWWGGGEGPQPPWIRGCDEDNLALTRRAQADIWKHQHPVNCSADHVRFLFGSWVGVQRSGLGSQIHLMTTLLALAVSYNRVLVPVPSSFSRANHEGCAGAVNGSLDCYFWSMTSPECTKRVVELSRDPKNWTPPRRMRGDVLLRSTLRIVQMERGSRYTEASSLWGTPWRTQTTTEVFGSMTTNNITLKVQWWRAQAVRYMLRWPTPYLCHVINKVHHVTMGKQTANGIASAEIRQTRAEKINAKRMGNANGPFSSVPSGVNAMSLASARRWDGEAYMPRPIVSIHVRQGDKGREMRLVSFAAHMWMAERLRFHSPDLENVWLSTEMELVVKRAHEYQEWKFLYNNIKRQIGATRMINYENSVGHKTLLDASFANLLISSECDFFLGNLGPNWNRFINELRLINGRFKSGYVSLQFKDW